MNVRLNSITTSRRWLMPRQRMVTMPTLEFDFDSRSSRISLSAHSVSPAKTGFGSLMSVHCRLAAAFSLVSGTVMPVISASVNVLFTSGWPNCVRSAYVRLDDALRPFDLRTRRREDAVHDLELRRVDACLAAEPERAREPALLLEPRVVLDVEVDDVEGRPDARGGRVEDDLRARI